MRRVVLLVLLLVLPSAGMAQPRTDSTTIAGESVATRKRLGELQTRLAAGADILPDLLAFLDDAGDDLVATERPGFLRPARHYAHALIGQLPAPLLDDYRRRVDASAKRLYDDALATRSTRSLVELLERFEHARIAPEARRRLGEWQLESGKPASAEATWLTLDPSPALLVDAVAARKQRLVGGRHATWSTLGGDAGRSGRVTAALPTYWPSQPTWRAPIAPVDRVKRPDSLAISAAPHPVVLGKTAYFADATTIYAVPLAGGEVTNVFAQTTGNEMPRPKAHTVDFALTVADGAIYARIGPAALYDAPDERPPASRLVRLEPQANGRLQSTWSHDPPAGAVWQGAPAVANGRIVAGWVRRVGNRLTHGVTAMDSRSTLWERTVAETDVPPGEPRTRHELVSMADDVVAYATHAGATMAMDAVTGRPLWAWRSPRLDASPRLLTMAWTANHRDINPPLLFDGICVVAPNDSDRIAAIDARRGTVLWEHVGYRVESVMGVALDRVVVTMAGPLRGVRAFGLSTGIEELPDGWANTDDPGLASLGRGLLSDDQIVWPTRHGLFFLNPKSGRPKHLPLTGPHGNLAFADRTLIVVTPNEVLGYVATEPYRYPAGRSSFLAKP